MSKIYILLPVHNRKEITRHFVECLRTQTFTDYHLVLIDDGSTDGTAEMVKKYIPSSTVLVGSGDWWWAGSLQRGLDWLRSKSVDASDLILFINDDVKFAPDYLQCAVRVMANRKHVLMLSRFRRVGCDRILETGVFANLRRMSFEISDTADRINCLSTRGLFVHWQDLKAIGGFHPTLLPHYLSDYEYTLRAHRKGFKCETSDDLLIVPTDEATGHRVINDASFLNFMKKYWSKKSAINPVYWSAFVVLTSEPMWVIPNLSRVWIQAFKTIIRAFLVSRQSCEHR
jgi:GT2 family glycosyltransferase